jgi:hypothetical protein
MEKYAAGFFIDTDKTSAVLLRRMNQKYIPVVGSVVSSRAPASIVLLFTRIK